jgi:hypothetical protein
MSEAVRIAVETGCVSDDRAAVAGFNREEVRVNLLRLNHHDRIFELSAKTGDRAKERLVYLEQQRAAVRNLTGAALK